MTLDYTQLGSWISAQASEHFKRWYSSNTNNYIDEIKEEFVKEVVTNDYESTIVSNCHIELTENGKTPLILRFRKETKLSITGLVINELFIV